MSSHIQSLCNPRRVKTEDNVRTALAGLPKELHETYAIIMQQVFDQELPGPEIAITAMKWLICAAQGRGVLVRYCCQPGWKLLQSVKYSCT